MKLQRVLPKLAIQLVLGGVAYMVISIVWWVRPLIPPDLGHPVQTAEKIARALNSSDSSKVRLDLSTRPEAYAQVFVEAARQTPDDQAAAPGWFADLDSPERFGEALRKWVGDPDWRVRLMVLQAASSHGEVTSSLCVGLLSDPHPVVRERAVQALASRGSVTQELRDLTASTVVETRLAATRALAKINVSPNETNLLLPLTHDPDARIRQAAAYGLTRIREEKKRIAAEAEPGSG